MNETYEDEYNSEWDATERRALTRSSFWTEVSLSVFDCVPVLAAVVSAQAFLTPPTRTEWSNEPCPPTILEPVVFWDLIVAWLVCAAAAGLAIRWYGRKRRALAIVAFAIIVSVAAPIGRAIGMTHVVVPSSIACSIFTF